VRLPSLPNLDARLSLGVGIDLPWGAPIGFLHHPVRGDVVSSRVVRFLEAHAARFSHLFVSFQVRNRNRLAAEDYFDVYDDLWSRVPPQFRARALHQTTFNLGGLEPYDRGRIVDFTNALIERYDLAWVNEDLGLWSIHGHPLPYPLPPYLTEEGLRAAVANTTFVQERLRAPLLVEFPGFSAGTSFVIGRLNAYDFFRRVVEESGSPATLDIGHLLSYQWFCGKRGEELYAELDRLPLTHCFEIHLSGCALDGGRFLDLHHGVLLEQQLELLLRLAPRCPNLRAITYEDPKFDEAGVLTPESVSSCSRLSEMVARWQT
jgi:uncharacterized protein (UPF0276 family)